MSIVAASQLVGCNGCGETYDPARAVHICYGMHPDHPLEECAPTLARFMESDAFVRFVIGPVGSGKSSVSLNEIVRRGMEVPACKDGVRRSRYAVVRNCYDAETEILTEHRGWVRFADLDREERVAALHGDQVVWEVPTLHYAAHYVGGMVGISTQTIDLLVTQDHHLWVSPRRTRQKVWGTFRHERAQDLEGVGELYRMRSTAEFPEARTDDRSEAFFEFLGFWFAEGYAGIYPRKDSQGLHYRLVVTQSCDPYVDDLLSRAGFAFGICRKGGTDNANYTISTATDEVKTLIADLVQYGHAVDKWLPREIIEAPKALGAAFLRGYHRGDGSGGLKDPEKPEQYRSRSEALLSGVQEMLIRQGRAAVLHGPDADGMCTLTALSESRSSPVISKESWRREAYSGMVYCVEVSTHVVLVRRRGRVVWCGQTYGELADTTKKTFDQWVPNPSAICEFNGNEFSAQIRIEGEDGTRVHIEVMFRALDRPDHVKKLLSLELTGAYINEVKEVPKAVFDMLGNRVGRFPSRADVTTKENPTGSYWFGVWCDSNPCDTDHWIYKLFEGGPVLEREIDLPDNRKLLVRYELFQQPSGLSPQAENLPFLPDGYYQRQMLGKDEDWINVYVRGLWGFVRVGKPVFPDYNDALHCKVVVPNAMWPILLGMDFGLTPAAVLAQRAPGSGQLQVFDELVSEDLGAVSFARELARKIKAEYPNRPVRGWGDPAGEQRSQVDERTPFEVVQSAGLPVDAAPTNDPRRRQEAVSGLLTRLTMTGPAIIIDPKARTLRKGFMGGYCRQRVKVSGDERYHDEPVKNAFSHIHDGLQYLCVGEGEDTRAIHGAVHRKVKVRVKVRRAVKGF
jgi:hypothetical protein